MYANRKYSKELAYDERVMDVKWFNTDYGSVAASVNFMKPPKLGGANSGENAKAVIVSNLRIYIVDKYLGVI